MNNQAIQGQWDHAALADLLGDLRDASAMEGLFGGLRMDALLEDVGGMAKSALEPPEEFPEVGEDLGTEHKCPKCGYEWSGKKR